MQQGILGKTSITTTVLKAHGYRLTRSVVVIEPTEIVVSIVKLLLDKKSQNRIEIIRGCLHELLLHLQVRRARKQA